MSLRFNTAVLYGKQSKKLLIDFYTGKADAKEVSEFFQLEEWQAPDSDRFDAKPRSLNSLLYFLYDEDNDTSSDQLYEIANNAIQFVLDGIENAGR